MLRMGDGAGYEAAFRAMGGRMGLREKSTSVGVSRMCNLGPLDPADSRGSG